ncbi:MAG: ISL3 family transposase [Anaerolineae bacterium]|nr:ISL3 family transposase [Anaerolineae bacterium]MCO5193022.1 ISL3 family transposase [Anaerolineae bacterium]
MKVAANSDVATCPACGEPSATKHSWYERVVQSLAWAKWQVMLQMQVQRYRCKNQMCQKQTFAERFPELVGPYARQTKQVEQSQQAIGLAMAARAAEVVLSHMRIGISDAAVNNRLRALPDVEADEAIRVVGIDDWAQCRRRRYGTIVVDLEKRQVIDLLADSQADTVEKWLKTHPTIEVVSRDRAGAYAEGARQGVPDAQQVADRWHLLHNLWDALAKTYEAHAPLLREYAVPMLYLNKSDSPSNNRVSMQKKRNQLLMKNNNQPKNARFHPPRSYAKKGGKSGRRALLRSSNYKQMGIPQQRLFALRALPRGRCKSTCDLRHSLEEHPLNRAGGGLRIRIVST